MPRGRASARPDVWVSASQHMTPLDTVLQEARRLEGAVPIPPPASSKTSSVPSPEAGGPPAPCRSNLEGGGGTQRLPTSARPRTKPSAHVFEGPEVS